MPPKSPLMAAANRKNISVIYGHRKPTQNRPTVRGGLFFNPRNSRTLQPTTSFDIQKWDPELSPTTTTAKDPSRQFFSIAQKLSPIARCIVDSFRKNKQWGPIIVADLNKLRRVTPKLVAEVLKVPDTDPRILTKFFHWAGKQKGYRHDFACYNAFSYCLNRTNQFRAADQVPELMQMQGKPPSEKQFEILIRMHSDANRGLRVYYVYEKMKKFGVKPQVCLYNRIMDALVKTNHLDLAMSVYDDFREEELVEENVTIMILIKGLCKAGRIDEVLVLLGRMREKLCRPDVFAYTAMVRLLVSEGNLDGCLRIWEEMHGDKIEPDVMAYGTLITGLCKAHQLEKGFQFFKEMKKKKVLIDRAIYGSLIEAFVADGKVGSAFDLLKDLMDSGYRADLAIYNSLIEGLCNANWVEKAYKLFQVTVQEDLCPDFLTVNPILVSYAELKRMDDFYKLLVQMKNLGLSVTDDLSNFFTFLVGRKNGIMIALEVFKHLKVKGYHSASVYSVLMDSLLETGEVNKTLSLFHELRELDLKPDPSTYSNAIICFVKVEDFQEACACYNEIKEMSAVPSTSAYSCLVKGLCKIGEIDSAMMLVRDCLANVASGPMEFKCSLTILHVCKSNDSEKVIELLDEMIQEGCPLDEVTYSAVIYGMCKHGTIEEARKVFSTMRERRLLREVDLIVFNEILTDHMKRKTDLLRGLKFSV